MKRTTAFFRYFQQRYYKFMGIYKDLLTLDKHFDKNPIPPDILYLGDSVLKNISRHDTDHRMLDEIVSEFFHNQKIIKIAQAAYHPGVFYALIKALEKMANRPKLLLLPVNMRCFSPQWDIHPNYQFHMEIDVLERYSPSRPSTDFRLIKQKITKDAFEVYDSTPVQYPCTSLDHIGQFRLLVNADAETSEQKVFRLRQIFIFHYMHILLPDHDKIRLLRDSLQLAAKMNIRCFIYTTPCNYQAGEKFVGDKFTEVLQYNVQILQNSIKSCDDKNLLFWNASSFLPSECFIQADIANEHLNQDGRQRLAASLAEQIKEVFQ
jgi:hypothetical protein